MPSLSVARRGIESTASTLRPAGIPASFASTTAVTMIPYSDGQHVVQPLSSSLRTDTYGNTWFGANAVSPSQLGSASNNNFSTKSYPLVDGLWYVGTARMFMRHYFCCEYQNPANIQLGRVNGLADTGPYPVDPEATLAVSLTSGVPAPTLQVSPMAHALATGQNVRLTANFATNTVTSQAAKLTAPVAAGGTSLSVTATDGSAFVPTFSFPATTTLLTNANGNPNWGQATGVLSGQTLGKLVFWGGLSTWALNGNAAVPGGFGSVNQQDSAQIYAQSFEDFYQFDSNANHFYTGGGIFVSTRPVGFGTGVVQPINDVFGFHATGFTATLTGAAGGLSRNAFTNLAWPALGDFISAGNTYAFGRVVAKQDPGNAGAIASQVSIGDVGPSSQAGVNFGPDGSMRLYRDTAAMRFSSALTVDQVINSAAGLKFTTAGQFVTTVGAAGGASALPATPTKYLTILDNTGATFKIPCYAP